MKHKAQHSNEYTTEFVHVSLIGVFLRMQEHRKHSIIYR